MTPETRLKKQIQKTIRLQGGYYITTAMLSTAGVPDMWCVVKGKQFWLEVKSKKGKVSKIQQWVLDQLTARGVAVYVVHSFEEFKEIL